jgi:hypothetical protein
VLVLTAAAQTQSLAPGPEHKRLEVFVGNWTFQGEAKAGPAGPGGKITGSDRNQLLGGFFIERQVEETGPTGKVTGRMMIGYDPVKKTYITSGFDSTGAFNSGTVTVSGNTWTFMFSGVVGGKPVQSRCPLTFAAGNNSFTVKCDDSTDGKTWTPTFEGQWTKSR